MYYTCILSVDISSPTASQSSEPVQNLNPAADSSSHTSPSSADTPSDSTVQSVGAPAVDAESSDKNALSISVEFRDDSQR